MYKYIIMRYYEKKMPQLDDIVFFRFLRTIEGDVSEVDLVEYKGQTALIMPDEIIKIKQKNTSGKIYPERMFTNKIHAALVCGIDEKTNNITLSYRRITDEDKLLRNFGYIEKIHNIAKEINCMYGNTLDTYEKVCRNTVWHIFYKTDVHLTDYDAVYKSILNDPSMLFANNSEIEQEFVETFLGEFRNRIKSTPIVIERCFELRVFEPLGVEKIKTILADVINVQIECVSSPVYKIIVSGSDKKTVEKIIENVISIISNNCKPYKTNLLWMNNVIARDISYTLKQSLR